MSATARWAWLALALLVAALFCRLGSWQLARMHEKQSRLEAAARVLETRHPLPLEAAFAVGSAAQDYAWLAGAGEFIDAPAVLLDNQMRDGRAGVRVYRWLRPDRSAMESGGALLVEMGWLPMPPDRHPPVVPRPVGTLAVRGLLLPPPSSGRVAESMQPVATGARLVTRLDIPVLAAATRIARPASRVLRLDPALPWGYPRDLDILPNTLPPERHLGYAVQWFGLAAAGLMVALVLLLRGRPRARAAAKPGT